MEKNSNIGSVSDSTAIEQRGLTSREQCYPAVSAMPTVPH